MKINAQNQLEMNENGPVGGDDVARRKGLFRSIKSTFGRVSTKVFASKGGNDE